MLWNEGTGSAVANTNMVFYVKTANGQFGPYPSRAIAEQMIANRQIPTNPAEYPTIVERFLDGREMLFG